MTPPKERHKAALEKAHEESIAFNREHFGSKTQAVMDDVFVKAYFRALAEPDEDRSITDNHFPAMCRAWLKEIEG